MAKALMVLACLLASAAADPLYYNAPSLYGYGYGFPYGLPVSSAYSAPAVAPAAVPALPAVPTLPAVPPFYPSVSAYSYGSTVSVQEYPVVNPAPAPLLLNSAYSSYPYAYVQ